MQGRKHRAIAGATTEGILVGTKTLIAFIYQFSMLVLRYEDDKGVNSFSESIVKLSSHTSQLSERLSEHRLLWSVQAACFKLEAQSALANSNLAVHEACREAFLSRSPAA